MHVWSSICCVQQPFISLTGTADSGGARPGLSSDGRLGGGPVGITHASSVNALDPPHPPHSLSASSAAGGGGGLGLGIPRPQSLQQHLHASGGSSASLSSGVGQLYKMSQPYYPAIARQRSNATNATPRSNTPPRSDLGK